MGVLDTLRGRGLPQTTYPVRAVPSAELAAAQREAAAATVALRDAEAAKRVTGELRRKAEKAQERVHACYVQVTIKAIPPEEMEDLIGEHKPSDEERGEGALYNRKTFVPELMARCIFDDADGSVPAATAAEWAQEVSKGNMSLGEAASLFQACWDINDRTPDPDIPKG